MNILRHKRRQLHRVSCWTLDPITVNTLPPVGIDAFHHLVGLVKGVLAGGLSFLILVIGLQDQIAALIIAAGGIRLLILL